MSRRGREYRYEMPQAVAQTEKGEPVYSQFIVVADVLPGEAGAPEPVVMLAPGDAETGQVAAWLCLDTKALQHLRGELNACMAQAQMDAIHGA